MVSTQNTFFATNPGFPSILNKSSLPVPDCVPAALCRSEVIQRAPIGHNPTPRKPHTQPIAKIINKVVEPHTRPIWADLQFAGVSPKSAADLLALGAKRNDDVIANSFDGETAAFDNDLAYYKVLLEARKRHREALNRKLDALRAMRAKHAAIFRKRAKRAAAGMPPPAANPDPGVNQEMLDPAADWQPLQYRSPASTDIESESDVSSKCDEEPEPVSVEKPLICVA